MGIEYLKDLISCKALTGGRNREGSRNGRLLGTVGGEGSATSMTRSVNLSMINDLVTSDNSRY